MSEPVRPEELRVSNADREAVQERLRQAHAEGLIDLTEFDSRVQAVWAAKTRGELAGPAADLPAPTPAKGRGTVFSATGGGTAMRVLSIVFGSIAAVNLVIWGLLVLTTGEWIHPWWVWVAAPPAAVLLLLYFSGIGRPDDR
ncbi:DUF1707 domain-containing protein [Pseudonocardia bannensis]|uniref:DUF1707 domain-containing protein n=1 Tax=Pseudonocardia bannensis TaxID=630973 RepID=UPI001B7CF0F3|nr:DUF1707 domain-containing protein [Pseudonocardia bannensis]